jgi:hypothetical protein
MESGLELKWEWEPKMAGKIRVQMLAK